MILSIAAATPALTALLATLNGGSITLYDGVQPANPELALNGNNALVSFSFGNPAFGTPSASGGKLSATANMQAATRTPSAIGTATFARASAVDRTALADFSVGVAGSGADMILATLSIAGAPVTISAFSVSVPCL